MESQLLSIQYSDPFWIAIAFLCGLLIRVVGLPPLVGFLAAGFLLNALGVEGGEFLNAMADLGITLLLFFIGLKLKLTSLGRPEVWGVATLHMVAITLLIAAMMLALSYTNLPLLSGVNVETALLVGFAMSFSSTVFAVKVFCDALLPQNEGQAWADRDRSAGGAGHRSSSVHRRLDGQVTYSVGAGAGCTDSPAFPDIQGARQSRAW